MKTRRHFNFLFQKWDLTLKLINILTNGKSIRFINFISLVNLIHYKMYSLKILNFILNFYYNI